MTIFDLLFILLFLASVLTFITSAIIFLRGQHSRALRIQKTWGICFIIYLAIVAVVALATPQRIIPVGEPRCFDDWCIAVQHAEHKPAADGTAYTVTLQVSSRAKRITQREKGMQVYLMDAQRRRFSALPDSAAIPLDVLLEPGQAVDTQRTFILPKDSREVAVLTPHEGSFCFPGCFIIGDDGNPLHKPTIVPLP